MPIIYDYLITPGTTPGVTPYSSVEYIFNKINEFHTIQPTDVFLDIGSGDGSVVNDFKQISGVTRSVGVEMQKYFFDKSVNQYPNLEFHNNIIQNKLDVLATADIIYTNNICIPNQMFWDIFDSIKIGAVVIFNRIDLSIKLRRAYGYTKADINKFTIECNNMNSEFNLIIKK